MEQLQTCPLVSRLLGPMRYIPECMSPELCVCPYAMNDPGKRHFPTTVHLKASITLKMQCFLWGEKTKQLSDFLATRFLNAEWAVLCSLLQKHSNFNDGSEPSSSTARDLPGGSCNTYTAPMVLGHYWGLWDLSHSQISGTDVLRVWWEWGRSTTL